MNQEFPTIIFHKDKEFIDDTPPIVDEINQYIRNYSNRMVNKMSGISNNDLINHEYSGWWEFKEREKLEKTKLKVTLSRYLTLSEREYFRVEFVETSSEVTHKFPEPNILVIVSNTDSRELAWDIHEFLGAEFFNVHIRAVHTITPKVVV